MSISESVDVATMSVYLLTPEEGGRKTLIGRFYKPFMETAAYNSSSVILPSSESTGEWFNLGNEFRLDLLLAHPVAGKIRSGDEAVWREGNKMVAKGRIIRLDRMRFGADGPGLRHVGRPAPNRIRIGESMTVMVWRGSIEIAV